MTYNNNYYLSKLHVLCTIIYYVCIYRYTYIYLQVTVPIDIENYTIGYYFDVFGIRLQLTILLVIKMILNFKEKFGLWSR